MILPVVLDNASTVRTFFVNPWINGLILGIMILGVFISFRVLNVADLSVEGVLPMITMLTAVLIDAGWNPWLVLLLSILIGAVCGMLNAALTIWLKTPPLLSGIIVMALTFGFAIMINSLKAGQASFDPMAHLTVFNWLRTLLANNSKDRIYLFYASYLSYIIVAAVLLLVCAFLLYFFFGTELGMSIRASGKNPEMARANGINVEAMSIIALAISGGLIGLAACLYGQHNANGLPTDGQGMIVIALSSLFLGEIIVGTRTFKRNLIACLVGSIAYWYLIQLLMLIDSTGYMLSVYKALLLVVVIALQLGIARFRKRHPNKPKGQRVTPTSTEATKEVLLETKESFVRHCLGRTHSC
ncbi:MAG: hypothetical protein K6F32_05425 [Bacilli bacterium]|nr:hypothetical protein [Bacilli bacterium]